MNIDVENQGIRERKILNSVLQQLMKILMLFFFQKKVVSLKIK